MDNKNELLNISLDELSNNIFDDSLIKDNKICFNIENDIYRVRMPNQGEQSIVEHQKNLKQLEYIRQEGCITKNNLIEQLRLNNVIDIKKFEEQKEELTKELKKYWLLLAQKLSDDNLKITEYSNKIAEIQDNLQKIAMEISTHLSPALESRLEKFYVEALTVLCTEKYDGEKWNRVWKNLDEFNQMDSILPNKAIVYMTWLLLNRR